MNDFYILNRRYSWSSRLRRRPLTLESRMDLALNGESGKIPRRGHTLTEEHDPIIASVLIDRNDPKNAVVSASLKPWLARDVEVRNAHQVGVGRSATILRRCLLNGRSRVSRFGIEAGDDLYLKEGAYLDAYGGFIRFGRGAVCGQSTAIHGNGGVTIGDYFMMGHGSLILAGRHEYRDPYLPALLQGSTSKGVSIGNNVWIGAGSVILDGARIGNDVVISAGTVVRGEIPDGSIVWSRQELLMERINDDAPSPGKGKLER